MHVVPSQGAGAPGRRLPWLLATLIVVDKRDPDVTSITETREVQVCGPVDVELFVESRGVDGFPASVCPQLGGLLAMAREAEYALVHLPAPSAGTAQLLMVPTLAGYEVVEATVSFAGPLAIQGVSRRPMDTSPGFHGGVGLPPMGSRWSAISRLSTLVSNTRLAGTEPRITQQGVTVSARRVLAQNSLTPGVFLGTQGARGSVAVFVSNDPDSPTHWLTQLRMSLEGGSEGRKPSAGSAFTRSSLPVDVTVTVLHTCDRTSCLGCPDLRLQTLCYAARQCSIAR